MLKAPFNLLLLLGLVTGAASAQQPAAKDEFSTTDRAQSERYLARLQQRYQEIAREMNAVVREEKLADLKRTLDELDGKFVTWDAPTRFSPDGRSIVLDPSGGKRTYVFQLATTNYGEYLLPDLTTVRLQLGRELDKDAFRKLKGGEQVKFKAIISANVSQFGLSFNLVGRIVEDPFGQPLKYEAFQAKSTWAGQCVAGRNKYSLKIKVTEHTKDSFAGTCTDLKGSRAYAVTGKIDGDKAEMTIHRGNDREGVPYFTTFKGTITDGFVMKGTFEKGACVFSLME